MAMIYPDQPGTFTEWAVELTYNDGERRYQRKDDEEEARQDAERMNFDASWQTNLPDMVAARAVSRQVTVSSWTAA